MARKIWGLVFIIAIIFAVTFSSSPTDASSNHSSSNSSVAQPANVGSAQAPSSPVAGVPLAPLADQVILDDLIVDGSACLGMDCVNGESFGFDTLRLKENNLRIKFQDTSNSASFPTNDWTIVANDSSNGGNNYLAFEDSTAGNKPFYVGAGAGNSALYVEGNTGDVGLGTSSPVLELHIADGDTPTVRLDQDGTGGWGYQIWDVAGNETNFFIRDVSNGSALPFRIMPGNGSDVLVLKNNRVGITTNSPQKSLHISAASYPTIRLSDSVSTWDMIAGETSFRLRDDLNGTTPIDVSAGAKNNSIFVAADGNVGIGTRTTTAALTVDGAIHASGGLTRSSDRNLKENIEAADNDAILDQILATPIYYWNYTADSTNTIHLGPMAQDFNAASDLGTDTTIDTLDVTGALIASVQALNADLEAKDAEISALEAENAELEERLAALEAAVAQILEQQAESDSGE